MTSIRPCTPDGSQRAGQQLARRTRARTQQRTCGLLHAACDLGWCSGLDVCAIQSISSLSIRTQPWEAADRYERSSRRAPRRRGDGRWHDGHRGGIGRCRGAGSCRRRHRRILESAVENAGDGQTCLGAIVGVAGRGLWLHEALQADATAAALELMDRVRPPDRRSIYEYFVAELLRPVVGVEATRTRLQRIRPDGQDATASILYLRAWLPVLA